MSDLHVDGVSSWAAGTPDSVTTVVDNVDNVEARHQNGPADGILGLQLILGDGPTLKGSVADFATRFAVRHNPNGTHKTQPVNEGGTNIITYAIGDLIYASAAEVLSRLAIGTEGKVLLSDNNGLPIWGYAGIYSGPESIGASSAVSHGGDATISTNQNPYNGVKYFKNFTLNTGVTLTLGALGYRLIIIASESITINGTIDASGAGLGIAGTGAGPSGGTGGQGHEGGSGGGGGSSSVGPGNAGGAGGLCRDYFVTFLSGGSGGSGVSDAGDNGQNSGSVYQSLYGKLYGGAGGGQGGGPGGDGGVGGASVMLIAPIITLGASSTINTSGTAGVNGTGNFGSGGGGGGGNLIGACRRFNDQGCTFNHAGGSGGTGGSANGGNGGAGFRQILVYS